MGELHFGQSHSAAPIWELANLVDLNQWQWKPPIPPDARKTRSVHAAAEMRSLSDTVLSPLRSFFPRRADTTDDLGDFDEILLPQGAILSGVAEPSLSWDVDSTTTQVVAAGLKSLSQDMSNGTGVTPLFAGFCDTWQQALTEGLFHGEAIGKVLTGIVNGLDAITLNVHRPRAVDRLKLLLIEATIDGISKRGTGQTIPFDHLAWNTILGQVSKIKMNTTRIFTRAMACVPQAYLKSVSSGILENLDAFYNALGRVNKQSTLARQTAKLAAPLESLGRAELRFILDDATRKVLQYASVEGINYSDVRFGWLQLLARLPDVDGEYLAQVCLVLEGGASVMPLTESEVCQLFLVGTNSQVPLEQYTRLYKAVKSDGTKCYRLLGARLWQSRQFHHVRCLSKFLNAIGRESAITSLAKGVRNLHPSGPCSLATLALGMRKPQLAIDIFCLYEECRRSKLSFWESEFGFRALELLIWAPDFDHKKLWTVLKLFPRVQPRTRRGHTHMLNRTQISKLAAAGVVMGLSPHLSSREAFSLMTNCYLYLRSYGACVPRALLRALVHNVTRQLVDGQPGITSRLRYVLYIIHKEMGQGVARHVGLAMQRRRRFNFGLK
jgi:hypothetical protein